MQTVDMETEVCEASPFKNLAELYDSLDNLRKWPEGLELRESAEYAFQGMDVHIHGTKLKKVNRDEHPRTLICHDMKGGYLEDRFIEGSKAYDSYTFYHWSVIDTFVYFSHYFVTVPPYGWINAAHTHGVKVLGTVITERKGIWEEILQTEEAVRKFADALILVARFYKFEGWLLNIENEIDSSDINNLFYFVRYLTDKIHEEIDDSEIIWYDSVTNEGKLNWQNELNDKNKEFFINCDGIYLNYNWTDSRLASSVIAAKNLDRDMKDIYVGLDVWGRGCPGGGGFNSAYALEKIRSQGLSVAIFAPGWTHEYFGAATFQKLEDLFWAQLFPYLYIHVPIYDNEIFKTSFCRGVGTNYYRYGEIEYDTQMTQEKPFFNLTMQKPQISVSVPHLKFMSAVEVKNNSDDDKTEKSKKPKEWLFETQQETIRVIGSAVHFESKLPAPDINYYEFCDRFSYNGGGCLKLVTKHPHLFHRLFLVHVDFAQEIQASIVYEECENNAIPTGTFVEPILLLGNDSGLRSIIPYKSFALNAKWKMCIYLTNMKTVYEIGVSFTRECECYLGEIILEQRQRHLD